MENVMIDENNKFFDSIKNSELYTILNSNLTNVEKKDKLKKLKSEIENSESYKKKENESFMITANSVIKKIDEALANLQ
jgi:hypothetical protein